MALLEIRGLTKRFGGLTAVNAVDLSVAPGEIVSIIGPNGAGKTTIFNLISGFVRPSSGSIVFAGESIAGLSAHQICHRGIGRTFQIVKPLANMTVLGNVMVGAFAHTNDIKEARRRALDILAFAGLDGRADHYARNLTLAGRKRLEIARAMATQPKLLLLDEVVAGLNPTETAEMIDLIRRMRERGIAATTGVEHIMQVVMTLSDRIVVINHGEKIAEGTPKEIARDKRVIEAYLGEEYAAAG